MTTKVICAAALVGILGLVVSPAMANPTLTFGGDVLDGHWMQVGNYIYGELKAHTNQIPGAPSVYYTFCVERHEDISTATYDAVVNTAAIKGGEPVSDPLSGATAWLYTQYLNKATVGTTNFGAMTSQIGYDLQIAIYLLENEDLSGLTVNAQAVALQNAALASGWGNNLGNVRVLNLYVQGSHANAQDVLVSVPAPGALILGGIGLGLVGLVKRWRAA